jgi:hypothetical protein
LREIDLGKIRVRAGVHERQAGLPLQLTGHTECEGADYQCRGDMKRLEVKV